MGVHALTAANRHKWFIHPIVTALALAFRGQNTLRALLIREEVSVDELLGVIAIIESAVRLA